MPTHTRHRLIFQRGTRSESRVPSILFSDEAHTTAVAKQGPPDYFRDLNLDQLVDSITASRDEYDLKPYFYHPLPTTDVIHFRQAVFRDVEVPTVFDAIQGFASAMRQMRSLIELSEKSYYQFQKSAVFLSAVENYCAAVKRLVDDLSSTQVASRGLRDICDYLARYTHADDFLTLATEAGKLRSDLNSVRYSLHIEGRRITVERFGGEPDLSAEVNATFEKFRQGASKDYRFRISKWLEMNHVEAAVLDRVARLYPEIFQRLREFPNRHSSFLDPVTARFDREVQFYLSYVEFKRRIQKAGLPFCYPAIMTSKEVNASETFDLALASKLVDAGRPVVSNSFFLKDRERVIVVSGPNQGGKTTFARGFGQLHYLACLGCPVPGTAAKLFLFDQMFTHFERQEDLENLSGKLEDELNRIHEILERATSGSILIMNESFLSTTLNDALLLSEQIMERIFSLDMLCVTVTFLDELSTFSSSTVSMVSTVDPQDPALRTFKIIRRPADGLAYAAAIAQKYSLTHDAVVERISANSEGAKPS